MGTINVTPTFVLAGEATFTVDNGSGKHYTYKVWKSEPTQQYPNPDHFIDVLAGPENTTDFIYMGRVVVTGQVADIRLTLKSKVRNDDIRLKVARWALRVIWQVKFNNYKLPMSYSIRHMGNCGKCGRPLTTPASLDTGLGPDCAEALGVEWRERPGKEKEWVNLCEKCGKRPSVGTVPLCHECAQTDANYVTGVGDVEQLMLDTEHPGHPSNYGSN